MKMAPTEKVKYTTSILKELRKYDQWFSLNMNLEMVTRHPKDE